MRLDGANVVVTGGARGIGAALVRRFHAAGANVVVADVLDASPVAEPLGRAVAAFGPVDLFFANAGLAIGTDLTMPEQEWELAMHVNVDGSQSADVDHRTGRLLVTIPFVAGDCRRWSVSTLVADGRHDSDGSTQPGTTTHGQEPPRWAHPRSRCALPGRKRSVRGSSRSPERAREVGHEHALGRAGI